MPLNRFIYPRTISIRRPGEQLSNTGGAAPAQASQPGSSGGYWGASTTPTTDPMAAGETTIATGVPCSIQGSTGRATGTGELPTDAPGPSRWSIFIPIASLAKGLVTVGDIIVDDEGTRYQVSAPYWNSLGYKLEAIRLEN